MAVTMTPVESSLKLVVVTGMSDNGRPVVRTRTYNRLKSDADPQAVYDTAQAIGSLQQHPVSEIRLVVGNSLSEL